MRTLILLLLFIYSCASDPVIVGHEHARNLVAPTIDWDQVRVRKSGLPGSQACLYHLIDFTVDPQGVVSAARAIDYSQKAFLSQTVKGIKSWKFAASTHDIRRGRVGILYRAADENPNYFVIHPDAELGISKSEGLPYAAEPSGEKIARLDHIKVIYPDPTILIPHSGYAVLSYVIRPDGRVAEVLVDGAYPPGVYNKAAVETLRSWKYTGREEQSTRYKKVIVFGQQGIYPGENPHFFQCRFF